jgi:hypothetical protein
MSYRYLNGGNDLVNLTLGSQRDKRSHCIRCGPKRNRGPYGVAGPRITDTIASQHSPRSTGGLLRQRGQQFVLWDKNPLQTFYRKEQCVDAFIPSDLTSEWFQS